MLSLWIELYFTEEKSKIDLAYRKAALLHPEAVFTIVPSVVGHNILIQISHPDIGAVLIFLMKSRPSFSFHHLLNLFAYLMTYFCEIEKASLTLAIFSMHFLSYIGAVWPMFNPLLPI